MIIVMLRNPLEMLPSYHAQMLYTVVEDVDDFEVAWNLQKSRKQGRSIPKGCIDSELLQYERWGRLGENVARVLEIFRRPQVRIIFFEDFIRDTRSCYIDVLSFLGVDDDNRFEFPAVNERKEHKSRVLGYLLNNRGFIARISWLRDGLEKMGVDATGLKEYIKQLNARKTARTPLSTEFSEKLVSTFRSDIKKLEVMTRKDLSHWCPDPEK